MILENNELHFVLQLMLLHCMGAPIILCRTFKSDAFVWFLAPGTVNHSSCSSFPTRNSGTKFFIWVWMVSFYRV